MKRQNLESKVLVADEEEWVDDEESSDKEVKNLRMKKLISIDALTTKLTSI